MSTVRQVDTSGSLIIQALMPSLIIVKVKVAVQARLQFGHPRILEQIYMLILDRPPEPLDEDVVQRTPTPIHAHPAACLLYGLRKGGGRELRALIGVENFGVSLCEGGLERGKTEAPIQGIRELPGDNIPAEPVENRDEIHEPVCHRDVRNVRK